MTARRFFLLFFLCALVPFAAAKISLSLGWFNTATINKGEWMTHEISMIPAFIQGDRHWTIAYVYRDKCNNNCMEAITVLQQMYTGLGRKQLGVQAMVISNAQPSFGGEKFPGTDLRAINFYRQQDNLEVFDHHFVIINQQGVALLRYPLSKKLVTQAAADMRSDLLRLFNYDRSRL
jgi:hypothetical protein